jgi:hypothetical protein
MKLADYSAEIAAFRGRDPHRASIDIFTFECPQTGVSEASDAATALRRHSELN